MLLNAADKYGKSWFCPPKMEKWDEMELKSVAKNLDMKSARVKLDMSQEDLAKAVGVTRQTISCIENGAYNPTLNVCKKICKVLHKNLDELFGDEP